MTVAVLFARSDSYYKTLPGCDVYDIERDARTYDGPWPVVAHPPCRAWGRLRAFANPRPDERNLARLAVAMVREFGGVLEHPAGSTLWPAQRLPRPGERDAFNGWTLAAPQKWWGHKAEKETWFYVVGCEPRDMPELPYSMAEATHVVQSRKREDYRPHITKAEREHTPPELARWLVELARRCDMGHKGKHKFDTLPVVTSTAHANEKHPSLRDCSHMNQRLASAFPNLLEGAKSIG